MARYQLPSGDWVDDTYKLQGEEREKALEELKETIRKILVYNLRQGDEATIKYIEEHGTFL